MEALRSSLVFLLTLALAALLALQAQPVPEQQNEDLLGYLGDTLG
ncbi:hypothetical protein X975_21980, partial [Stegodyphus mimosarum]